MSESIVPFHPLNVRTYTPHTTNLYAATATTEIRERQRLAGHPPLRLQAQAQEEIGHATPPPTATGGVGRGQQQRARAPQMTPVAERIGLRR